MTWTGAEERQEEAKNMSREKHLSFWEKGKHVGARLCWEKAKYITHTHIVSGDSWLESKLRGRPDVSSLEVNLAEMLRETVQTNGHTNIEHTNIWGIKEHVTIWRIWKGEELSTDLRC